MYDWLQKFGNFNPEYIATAFQPEGYFDVHNFNNLSDDDKTKLVILRRESSTLDDDKYTYEFIFIPNAGFLNENKPLAPGCELKLTFDRLEADSSLIKVGNDDPLTNKVIQLKNEEML